MCYAGSIDILIHSDILSQYWKVIHVVIIDCMKVLLYQITSDVLELTCMISPFYIVGGVSFLLVLHFWYWGMGVVHHDFRFLVLYEVPHIMIKQTILGHLKCCPLWDVDDKLISISAVVDHRVIFLDQAKGKDVRYSLVVIPYRIRISQEVANFVVCVTPALQ